ncbi:MAG: acyl-CoA desaturase [Herpetosiphonaceae bacterium]|nr:acyl-CoA desaturase [Herpetosiphonaceae bacterium]
MDSQYRELKRRVLAADLLTKQPHHALRVIIRNLLLLTGSIVLFALFHAPWALVLNAVMLGVIFGQLAYILHDAGHRQLFNGSRQNALAGLIHGNLLLGVSYGWWVMKHNDHHANPNQLDADPELDIPIIAYTPAQALASRGLTRWLMRYQAFWFVPLLCLAAPIWYYSSVLFMLRRQTRYRWSEPILFLIHWAIYLAVPLYFLGPWATLLMVVVHQLVTSFALASSFAPNHKGMLLIEPGTDLEFLQAQVLTARNIRGNPVTDFWYGGLNYQIEHHLFPTMPRPNLRAGQAIVKAYCAECRVPYYETSIPQSYREILGYLHTVSAPLRTRASLPILTTEER